MIETPKTGIYSGIPEHEYHAWHGLNATGMWHLRKSPAHYKYHLDHTVEPTPAMLFGSAMHCRLLGSDFEVKYVVYPGSRRGKAWEDFIAENHGKIILTPEGIKQINNMCDTCLKHPTFARLRSSASDVEVSALWESEVLCKGRADMLVPSLGTILDYKTTTDASVSAFEKSILNCGYHIQAAHYLDGFNSEGVRYEHFVFVVQEKSAPYAVAIYRITEEILELARKEIKELKQRFSKCATINKWGGYPEEVQDIGLPRWAKQQLERQYE